MNDSPDDQNEEPEKDEPEKTSGDVEIFNRVNRLKIKAGGSLKAGPGQIDPKFIEEADKKITDMCGECTVFIKEVLAELTEEWNAMKAAQATEAREDSRNKVFTSAHEIKDLAGMCGYPLLCDLGESLRDYIANTALDVDAQSVIVQAHIDAMNVAHRDEIKDDGGETALLLKEAVKKAIEKHG